MYYFLRLVSMCSDICIFSGVGQHIYKLKSEWFYRSERSAIDPSLSRSILPSAVIPRRLNASVRGSKSSVVQDGRPSGTMGVSLISIAAKQNVTRRFIVVCV